MRTIWAIFRLEIIALLAFICAIGLHGYITHPGVHVAGSVFLLDLFVLRLFRFRISILQILWLGALNLLGMLVIKFASDSIELGFTGIIGLMIIGLVLLPSDKNL